MSLLYTKDKGNVLIIRISEHPQLGYSIVLTEETRDRLLPYSC